MSDAAILVPFIAFCIAMTGTPGPNNMMVLAVVSRHGVLGAMPLVAGIAVGSALQMAAVGGGIGATIVTRPSLQVVLQVAGSAFLAWIAIQIARSGPLDIGREDRLRLVGFPGGAGFQWINPKAWAVTTGAAATYLPEASTPMDIGIASVVLALSAMTTLLVWAVCGSVLRRFLQVPRHAKIFTLSAAALLLLSIIALFVA